MAQERLLIHAFSVYSSKDVQKACWSFRYRVISSTKQIAKHRNFYRVSNTFALSLRACKGSMSLACGTHAHASFCSDGGAIKTSQLTCQVLNLLGTEDSLNGTVATLCCICFFFSIVASSCHILVYSDVPYHAFQNSCLEPIASEDSSTHSLSLCLAFHETYWVLQKQHICQTKKSNNFKFLTSSAYHPMKPTDVLTPSLHGLRVCQWNPEQQRSGAVEKALLNSINSLLPFLQNMLYTIGPVSCIHPIICFYNVLSDQLDRRLQSAAKLPLVLGAFLRSRTAMKQSFELPLTPTGCVTPKPTA